MVIYSVTFDIILLIFFRWRLQKVFFTPQSVGCYGCRGISCKEFFLVLPCFPYFRIKHDPDTYPLNMLDLEIVSPEYVSNVAVDYWRLNSSSLSTPPFAVMSSSPDASRRIDCQPKHAVKLPPRSVDQVDAMVTSAAFTD